MSKSTYIPLANITLQSSSQLVQFTNIPQFYNDLNFLIFANGSQNLSGRFRLNNLSGTSDYTSRGMGANTSGTTMATPINGNFGKLSEQSLAGTSQTLQINANIMGYSRAGIRKTIFSRANQEASATEFFANLLNQTAAVNSIQIFPSVGSWSAGSTFLLFGIE
jgi:hypothetical protein